MIGIAISNSIGLSSAAAAIDPAASAFIAATGITNPTEQQAINNLVKGLKADGIYSKMKAVYPFVTDNRNIFSYTEDFGNAFWFKDAVTITNNSITAPNGTLTADSIVENTANTQHYVGVLSGLTLTAVPYTISAYLKKANRNWASVGLFNGTDSKSAWFNLDTGTIGTINAGVTATIADAGNGWYRCSVTRTMAAVSNNFVAFSPQISDGSSSHLGNGLVGVYCWGAQLELGSTATTYQPIATTQQAFIANQFKYNLVNPVDSDAAFRLVFNGGWTHSSNGATPNGTNGYADTKFNALNNFIASSRHMSFYNRTNTAKGYDMGCLLSPNDTMLASRFTATTSAYTCYGTSAGGYTTAITPTAVGFIQSSNISNSEKLYKNGSSLATRTRTITNINLPIFIGASNINSSAGEYTDHQCSFASMGDGLTDTEAANLYTRVQAFQTALNRAVI